MRTLPLATILAMAVAAPCAAQMAPMASMPQAPCPASPVPLPPALAGWSAATPVKAATALTELSAAVLTVGKGVTASLSPTARIAYPFKPGHAGAPTSFGGLLAFTVTDAGTYRVALGAGAWIDVVKDGASITSSAHGHGPACSSVRKTVDFALQPGRYTLQVSGNAAVDLSLMVARLPA